MIESHVIDSDVGRMAENATTRLPTPGTVRGVQACGAANFNGILKLKGALDITYTGYLSLNPPPPKWLLLNYTIRSLT
jgi:hypothetical protein